MLTVTLIKEIKRLSIISVILIIRKEELRKKQKNTSTN